MFSRASEYEYEGVNTNMKDSLMNRVRSSSALDKRAFGNVFVKTWVDCVQIVSSSRVRDTLLN